MRAEPAELVSRYFLDTEFMEDGHTIDLLSIGVVCEDGREFYAENRYAQLYRANDWVKANVLPHLEMVKSGDRQKGGGITPTEIAERLLAFVDEGNYRPEFWGYFAAYDWVVVCQLFGPMIALPKGWPKFCLDIKQLADSLNVGQLPAQTSTEHHALADARWNRDAYNFLVEYADRG